MKSFKSQQKVQGVTLLIVLVIVALSTLVATQLIEQGTYSQRRSQMMMARSQGHELALGGEALARIWLAKGVGKEDRIHLEQPWATTPFEFPIEGGRISATVVDYQSCFNLNSLDSADNQGSPGGENSLTPQEENGGSRDESRDATNTGQPPGTPEQNPDHVIYERLVEEVSKGLDNIEISPKALTATVIDWVDNDIEPRGADGAEDLEYTGWQVPYRTANAWFGHVSELRLVKGYSAKVYEAIKPLVCVLPDNMVKQINVNTLTSDHAPILKALYKDMSLSNAQALISARPEDGYDLGSFQQELSQLQIAQADNSYITFSSDYFMVNISVDYQGTFFKMGSLIRRAGDANNVEFKVIARYFGDY